MARDELAEGMFRGRWNRASQMERQYLRAMAAGLGADGTASSGAVAAALGRDITNLSAVRRRLIDKGLIQAPGHGRLEFSIPGFDVFVLNEAES